jgi:hypothetical protein
MPLILELKGGDKGIMMFCGGGRLIEYLLLNIEYSLLEEGKNGRGEKG